MSKGTAQIQEEIRDCRGSRTAFLWLFGGGLLFAIFPLFITLFVLVLAILNDRPNPGPAGLEYMVWSLPAGIAIAVGGVAGAMYYDHKIKRLIEKLDSQEKD
ncbi:unnamed protein product [marine sediment metagenome]|uniref:Uncharacterized protein n=1 Tax=marine sediment metagenome TaxID=412755 RepID=X1LDI0_9ZZZZ